MCNFVFPLRQPAPSLRSIDSDSIIAVHLQNIHRNKEMGQFSVCYSCHSLLCLTFSMSLKKKTERGVFKFYLYIDLGVYCIYRCMHTHTQIRALHPFFQTSLLWLGIQCASNGINVPPSVTYLFLFFRLQVLECYRPMFSKRYAADSIFSFIWYLVWISSQVHYSGFYFNQKREIWKGSYIKPMRRMVCSACYRWVCSSHSPGTSVHSFITQETRMQQ